jgi:hypothetical protein
VTGWFNPEKPRMISHADYDAARRTFRLALLLPPKKSAEFRLTGFRSADGVPVEPLKLNYQVTGEKRAAVDLAQTKADAKDPKLLALLETIRQKRAQLTSLAERVQTLSLSKEEGVFTHLDSKSAAFQWQSPDRFYGDASEMMSSAAAFRIGSNGQNWWHYAGQPGDEKLVVCPAKEMHTLNVSLCDPFELTRKAPEKAAADLGLRLVGMNKQGGSAGHLLEAWSVDVLGGGFMWGQLTRWRINAETCRPEEVATFHPIGVTRTRFHYDAVNEPLPMATFNVPKLEGVSPRPPEALDADYTKRFINLRDGSNGRMSVRWGKKGPTGTSSSGLN